MKKIYYVANGERNLITVSSAADPETADKSITAETGGNCIGPEDDCSQELAYLLAHWNELKEMPAQETETRINHLADEWGLAAEDLDYLK